jgi:hypothetical protein
MTVSPPVNATKMRQLTKKRTAPPGYVTDGHWVLYEQHILDGADPASFETISLPPGSDKESARYGEERRDVLFGRDAKHVYFGAQRIEKADPVSFRLIYVSTESGGLNRGFWAFDRNAVWRLFDGSLTQADPEDATVLRPRLSDFKAPLTERYPFLARLVWPACVLILFGILGGTALIERRVWHRYKASTFEKPVAILVTASLLLPSFLYAVIFDSCHAPDDVVVHWFVAGMLGISVISLGFLNFAAMDRLSAIGVTAVQIAMIGTALVIGLAVPSVVHLLSSLPRGGMGACR